jgi:hypothetical protein
MLKKILIFITVNFLFSGVAFAAPPLITDDAETQGKGKIEIDMSGQYGYDRDRGVVQKSASAGILVSYGLIDKVDIVIGAPYQWIWTRDADTKSKDNGVGDASLAIKWKFYDQEGFGLAIKPGVTFPSGDSDRGFGSGKVGASIYLIASKEMKPFEFHVNAGYILNENKLDRQVSLWHASFAAEYEPMKKLKLVANIGADRNRDKGSDTPVCFLLGGVIYTISENVDLNAGYKYGLTRPEVNHTAIAGATLRF